ncbi:MAG TPA: helix-turn-helix domain-containing protein [Candidatus Thermoplasmatota archaeon]|nr:helix-turn-helix domain-containing protein [Candidatus Thermoplasmatota archaeon]
MRAEPSPASRSAAGIAFALALVLPGVLAAGAEGAAWIEVSSPEAVSLSGATHVDAAGGGAILVDDVASGPARFVGLTGALTVSWTNRTNARVPVGGGAAIIQDTEDASSRTFGLDAGVLAVDLDRERFVLLHPAGAARLTVAGPVGASGLPVRLASSYSTRNGPGAGIFDPGEGAPVSWPAGWAFTGAMEKAVPAVGFPVFDEATLRIEGESRFLIQGGNATFTDDRGRVQSVRLGNWTERGGLVSAGGVEAEVERRQWIVFEGEVGGAEVPLGGEWGVAAPREAWRIEGSATWRDATGSAEDGTSPSRFEHAVVTATGAFVIDPTGSQALVTTVTPASYAAEGDFRSITVDGRAIGEERGGVAPAVATVSILALVAGALTLTAKLAVVLYTRIAPDRVLDHPARRRIYDIVVASSGVQQQELHRRSGGAWGPFTFHLRILKEAGVVRREGLGRYAFVVAAGTRPEGDAPVLIPQRRARVIFDALPIDGAPVPVPGLRARLGMSRQLLDHHLLGLVARGVVRVDVGPDGARVVARVLPTALASDARA